MTDVFLDIAATFDEAFGIETADTNTEVTL
jgi:hypothetical protein